MAYLDMVDGDLKKASEYFNLTIAKETDETSIFAKIYSRMYLADEEYKNGNLNLASSYVKSAFKIVPKKDYNKHYKILADTLLTGVDYNEESRKIATKYLKSMLDDKKNLNSDAKFYLEYRIAPLYIIEGKYAEGIESTLQTIMLSRERKNKLYEAKSLIDLGLTFRLLGRYDIARSTIESALSIDLKDKNEEAIIKLYALTNLADIDNIKGDYKGAKSNLDKINPYINLLNDEEEKNDFNIMKYTLEADINIHNKDLEKARNNIEKAENLLKNLKKVYIADKDIYLKDVIGEYYEANYKDKEAIVLYKEAYGMAKQRKNIEYQRLALNNLSNLYKKLDYKDEVISTQEKIINLMDSEKASIGEDYVYYSSTLREKSQMVKEENKRKYRDALYVIFFLIASIIGYKYMNKLVKSNRYDSLTNVYNRGRFNRDYNKLIKKSHSDFALVMLDIDDFKSINDNFGHNIGDAVLINVCNVIKNVIGQKRELYRYGGEEFIIMFNEEGKESVLLVAERIRRNIEAMVLKENISVTISIGVAFSNESRTYGVDILKKADQNLYKSKTNGKNRVTYN
ncbi:MAG: diguanylate cyclase [Clostridium sp.]|uniref:diguanylate cyclase n=1 Tax=Clostridium chrysemydis TaxID=2665504 RepID=UPI003EE61C60